MSIYLSIVIPFYNEEESVQALIDSVKKTCVGSEYSYEIILVDDGSKDNTWCLIVVRLLPWWQEYHIQPETLL
jgi:glycosyltransferase involved in cell wall biosynthesis